jgi:hypothetical protein
MRHFVYQTTCVPTGKYYIGVHSERRSSDGYIGCGVCSDGSAKALKRKGIKSALIDSVIKYGYKNFEREILREFNSSEEAYNFESELINEKSILDQKCLNIKTGGIGGVNPNSCKSIEIVNTKTGEIHLFSSQAECANFLGLKNISGKKKFLKNLYIVKGFEKPITIKKPNEKPMHFYDVSQAAEFTSISVFSLNRLLSGERKSCNGWFLADFDFNSSFYKNAKSIRKNTVNLQL